MFDEYNKYMLEYAVLGMDNEYYSLGPDILSGKLLTHATKAYRMFITGYSFNQRRIEWKTERKYPAKEHYYYGHSIILKDYELDLLPKWKDDMVEVTKEFYDMLRFPSNREMVMPKPDSIIKSAHRILSCAGN